MLLTRSPLYNHPEVGYSFDLHVLSTPPAFILSQDQTLRSKSAPKDASSKNLNLGLLPRCPEPCSGGGHLTRFITSLFVSQYPVFKVLGGPSGPSRASAGGKRARRYITAPRYRCQELFFGNLNFISQRFDFPEKVGIIRNSRAVPRQKRGLNILDL